MNSLFRQKEWFVMLPIMVLVNLTLLWGQSNTNLIFLADEVVGGQWYRYLTAPFVHVSVYHLLIDGIAFVMLYASLPYAGVGRRLFCLAGIHAAVMTAVILFPGGVGLGYCGLSGIDHGLMALWCVELTRNLQRQIKRTGTIGLSIVTLKCLYEAVCGQFIFTFLHLGDVGTPVISSHCGGLLGGLIVYALMYFRPTTISGKILTVPNGTER